MRKTTLRTTLFCIAFIFSLNLSAQTSTCDGTLPFEEQNGLLTIEMESGNLPTGTNWKTGSEADPNLSGSTITFIYWDGPQSFNALSNAQITYNIKINTTGTYRFAWRGRIGTGTLSGEHNDAWLRIVADDWYMTQNGDPNASAIEPIPTCNSNPDRGCPDDAKVNGYIKAFMNRSPTGPIENRWGFVTNSKFNGVSQRFIWATFDTPGNYSVIIDARSSFFFMDKMVLRRTNVSDSNAFNLNNNESSCFNALSTDEFSKTNNIKVSPNPTKNILNLSNLPNVGGTISITNTYGVTVKKVKYSSSSKTIDISELSSGVYFITSMDPINKFVKKIIKI
ncbi:T9SS type A sorting domain-containing protein [Seonamhaeicola sediminis]|uniref:T9SS type A sorting domain-containing protein n=1 Tax=Seonamhaeicola sediminis TaxID=2528206 RepID=A0A562YE24_9FLAO|nr:T9SS type A sorting domain-containing protein [Seonamhaeicola sediminis]TWO32865.1 T9SS type A sorting domain-containing protein [Seonamhaeicola sediminis]